MFSMNGRVNRAKYLLYVVLITLVGYAIIIGTGLAVGASVMNPNADAAAPQTAAGLGILGVVMVVISFAIVVLMAFQVVKRLHDLDRPGSHYFLLLIPLYNLYIALILLFQKGTAGPNQFGPDPLAK